MVREELWCTVSAQVGRAPGWEGWELLGLQEAADVGVLRSAIERSPLISPILLLFSVSGRLGRSGLTGLRRSLLGGVVVLFLPGSLHGCEFLLLCL